MGMHENELFGGRRDCITEDMIFLFIGSSIQTYSKHVPCTRHNSRCLSYEPKDVNLILRELEPPGEEKHTITVQVCHKSVLGSSAGWGGSDWHLTQGGAGLMEGFLEGGTHGEGLRNRHK